MRSNLIVRLVFAAALIGLAYAIRAPLLKREIWNLDEGSTFTMAQQVLDGDVLYRDAADNRAPLVPYLKAIVFAIFGSWNGYAVHVLLALGLGVAAIFIWQIGRLLGSERTGVAAAAIFTALAFLLMGTADTMAAHTEWFLLFFSLVGYVLFAARGTTTGRFGWGFLTGSAFGLAALCKQPGLLDAGTTWVICGLLAWERPAERKRLLLFVTGQIVALGSLMAVTFLYFALHHAVRDFVFYAWTYNTKYYVPEVPLPERLAAVRIPLQLCWNHARAVALLSVGAFGWMLARVTIGVVHRQIRESVLVWLILGSTATGLLATTLSGRDFSHYAIQLMPGLSLAAGWLVDQSFRLVRRAPRYRPILAGIVGALFLGALIWMGADVQAKRRALQSGDDASKIIGTIVREHVKRQERIFVWGYVPELYYFSHRLPSTRFIYTNYVTGLIPWTNLDPLRDTAYASVPGSWAQLASDLAQKPPEMIVDTGTARGYAKYVLSDQPDLWKLVHSQYAEVETSAVSEHGIRLFRRQRPVTPIPFDEQLTPAPDVKMTSRIVPQGKRDLTVLKITGPAGINQVDLYRNKMLYRSVPYAPQRTCDASFWIESDGEATGIEFQAVLHDAAGQRASPLCRTAFFGPPADLEAGAKAAGPFLIFGSRHLGTSKAESDGRPIEPTTSQSHWSGVAPAQFVYSRTRGMTAAVLVAGANINPAQKQGSIRLTVSFVFPDGRKELLQERLINIDPNRTDPGEEIQNIRAALPGADPGDVVVEFSPVGESSAGFPPIFIREVRGQGSGPDLVISPQNILVPEDGVSGFDGVIASLDGKAWPAHAPSAVTYLCPPELRVVTVGFGLREGAWADSNGNRLSDGIEAIVSFQPKGVAQEQILFRRLIEPFSRQEDRGAQQARVALPPAPAGGTLRLKLTTGPRNDPSYDWAYMTEFAGETLPP
jgi:4-amino-4-deoxy-L-arabinose transferase-like glycosyltransferase